jgi:hypothetical protein
MWHLQVKGRPFLEFFLVVLNSCVWTACPVFIACTMRDWQHIEADWRIEGLFCTECQGQAAYFAALSAEATLALSMFWIAMTRHTFSFWALFAVFAVADEGVLKVGHLRAARELQ